MSKVVHLAGAVAAVVLIQVTAANAHSPHDVVHILRDHGYTEIEFVDPSPPNYMANACRDGIRYHFHVDYYGEVTERREIGYCGGIRDDDDDDRRSRWRRRY
jgi:hypothetical protein